MKIVRKLVMRLRQERTEEGLYSLPRQLHNPKQFYTPTWSARIA